jgi:hypothetical protein
VKFFNAPWRSLIWRNVHTPFTYSDSLTLYPHMPFDTGGHDCRAGQWLGEWMASIPSVRKHPQAIENFVSGEGQDTDPQPYTEVLPDAPGYASAVKAAEARVEAFRKDPRYGLCPDNSDLVDPDVTAGRFPTPRDVNADGVPDRPNWVVTDLTERKGLWEPRRIDWQDVLVATPPKFPPPDSIKDPGGAKLAAQKVIVEQLGSVHVSDIAAFASTPFPLALWKQKDGCKFDGVDKVSSSKFAGDARPLWFDIGEPSATAAVYSVLPGQAVYDMICINCHGPNADSLGRQADTLQNLTGGGARVANFRFGLFNPTSLDDPYDKPDLGSQLNRNRVFGKVNRPGVSADDWGGRYLAWMALGGTAITIPSVILEQVARTDVAGTPRTKVLLGKGDVSANMLQVAQQACRASLAAGLDFDIAKRQPDRKSGQLIAKNGDAELWTKVCGLHNALRVQKISFFDGLGEFHAKVNAGFYTAPLCTAPGTPAGCFPSDAPVGDERGRIRPKLDADNLYPWCLDPANVDAAQLTAFAAEFGVGGNPLPICPSSWVPPLDAESQLDAQIRWENRGAINAGLSVYTFLDQFVQGKVKHVLYDQCELLP